MVSFNYNQLYHYIKSAMPSRFEANLLFEHLTRIAHSRLVIVGESPAANELYPAAQALVARRLSGEPLQYILGKWEFYSLPFYVGEGVLIPRADTELLVDHLLGLLSSKLGATVLDLCSGTGCIGISVAKNSTANVTCVELSPIAFEYLQKNKLLNSSSVTAINCDALSYIPPKPIDILVSNPPYIPTSELPGLQPEVRKEPSMALDGGTSGLDFYNAIAKRYYEFIKSGGNIALEVGINQAKPVADILLANGYKDTTILPDLAGIQRVVCAKK